ncbi:MAG: hypothetical protein ACRELZ_22430 [Candidatus Rokuibacteriota bacterium]
MPALKRDVRRLPLRGADLVLLAHHPRWKGVGLGHNTLLVVECDGPIDSDRVARAWDRFLDVCPWPAARLRRPFPWGKLHWTAGARESLAPPAVRRTTITAREDLQRALATELNLAVEPRREAPLRVLIVDDESTRPTPSSVLVLTWFHPLMDARGGENLLTHLNEVDRHDGAAPWGDAPPAFVSERDRRSLFERSRVAGGSLKYLRTLAPVPPVSAGGQPLPPGRACFRRKSFVAPDSTDQRGTREICWRVALVGKAMAELWRRRDLADVPCLLPISVDVRPKGELGATFGNHLAFHFARFRSSDTADVPALARALRRQMADAVRDGQIEANQVALEFLQYQPLSRMLRVLPWTTGGELFSFNCADLADWPGALAECFGRKVVNAYHVPVVPPRPGIGVFFNRCGGRNNLVVSWIEGVASEAEAARIIEVVREGMGWVAES